MALSWTGWPCMALFVALGCTACGDDPSNEPGPGTGGAGSAPTVACEPTMSAFETAADAYDKRTGGSVVSMATRCTQIATDLGAAGNYDGLDPVAAMTQACSDADAAIAASTLSVTVATPMDCSLGEAVEADCMATCGNDTPTCGDACASLRYFQAVCPQPQLTGDEVLIDGGQIFLSRHSLSDLYAEGEASFNQAIAGFVLDEDADCSARRSVAVTTVEDSAVERAALNATTATLIQTLGL